MHLINCLNKHNQVTVIDIDTEKNRQDNYCSLSWTDFRTDEPVKDFFIVEKQPEVIAEVSEPVELTAIEKLQADYFTVTGKEAPARYKNDAERLQGKINETLAPQEEVLEPTE